MCKDENFTKSIAEECYHHSQLGYKFLERIGGKQKKIAHRHCHNKIFYTLFNATYKVHKTTKLQTFLYVLELQNK